MLDNYNFHRSLIFRTPVLKWQDFNAMILENFIKTEQFRIGILLASPILYRQLERKDFQWTDLNDKERQSIFGYYNRMTYRATPFGAFAGVGTSEWGYRSPGKFKYTLKVLPDWSLASRMQVAIGEDRFWLNPTLYLVSKEYRFIKTLRNGERTELSFSLEAINTNPILVRLLNYCRGRKAGMEELLAEIIQVYDWDTLEAREYLQFLIDAQWLVNREQPVINSLEKPIACQSIDELLMIGSNYTAEYDHVNKKQDSTTFYAALIANGRITSPDPEIRSSIRRAIRALSRLSLRPANPAMASFITDFIKRFDQQKIPLLLALDPFNGIGYHDLEERIEKAIIENINFKRAVKEDQFLVKWSGLHSLLLNKWHSASGANGIVITETDINELEDRAIVQPVIPVLFREIDNGAIQLDAVGGIIGTALTGRFTLWSAEIEAIAKELAIAEEQANHGVIFAELLQTSDLHVDNINRRVPLYRFEIPINATSTLSSDRQIGLDDLVISVRSNRVILESTTLNKVVIPRLSSAYNYQRNDLAIFRFLADMQSQGLNPVSMPDLTSMFPGLDFYPRLSYENIVLSPAKWKVSRTGKERISSAEFEDLKSRSNWPDMIAITLHDQQIVFDLTREIEVGYFLSYLTGSGTIWVQEYFKPRTDHEFVQQWITFLYNEDEIYKDRPFRHPERLNIKETEFIPGSEWLYLKLYCSSAVSNKLLTRTLKPAIAELTKRFNIKWFYIRYSDNGYHIRLRINANEEHIGPILNLLRKRISKEVKVQLVRAYQADIYFPEWERYGPDLMQRVESLFCASSELILKWLYNAQRSSKLPEDFAFGCRSTIDMVKHFISGQAEQLGFLKQMSDSFYQEFSGDKDLKISMDIHYREIRAELDSWLGDDRFYKRYGLNAPYISFMDQFDILSTVDLSAEYSRRFRLLGDLIHMQINRLFSDRQRQYELLIYYCLYKYLTSFEAKKRGKG